jgi:hypothetical protein
MSTHTPAIKTTKTPAEIIAAAQTAVATPTAPTPGAPEAAKTSTGATKSYQFPSAPTTFEFTHSGRRVALPDGVINVDDPRDIRELEACVTAGIVYGYIDPTVTPFAKPAAPLNPNITN